MKFLPLSLMILASFPAFAHEITSPFYLPTLGVFSTKTAVSYDKNKHTTNPTTRTYRQKALQEITAGLGAGLAGIFWGEMNWTRQKQETTLSFPQTKGYGAGLKGVWQMDSFLTQASVIYHQTTNVAFAPRRLIETNLYLGKQLSSMTPYLHLWGLFPLNARPEFNNPVYRAETGVFQSINTNWTLDTALFLNYDKNIQGRSYGIRSELSYLFTSWASIGINGEWQARGHAKNNTKTYHQGLGANLRFSF